MKRIVIGLASLGLFVAGCFSSIGSGGDIPCQDCENMLSVGYGNNEDNLCPGSQKLWFKVINEVCDEGLPCYEECKSVFCDWTTPMTAECGKCQASHVSVANAIDACMEDSQP